MLWNLWFPFICIKDDDNECNLWATNSQGKEKKTIRKMQGDSKEKALPRDIPWHSNDWYGIHMHICKIAANSLVGMVDYILTSIPGVSVFLSGNINKDSLENFFQGKRAMAVIIQMLNNFVKLHKPLRVANTVMCQCPH